MGAGRESSTTQPAAQLPYLHASLVAPKRIGREIVFVVRGRLDRQALSRFSLFFPMVFIVYLNRRFVNKFCYSKRQSCSRTPGGYRRRDSDAAIGAPSRYWRVGQMKIRSRISAVSYLFAIILAGSRVVAAAEPAPSADTAVSKEASHATRLILWGTAGGSAVSLVRAEPASLLVVHGKPYLIDAGSGVTYQLVKAGYQPASVHQVFITHHHADHDAGLEPLMSLQWSRRGLELWTLSPWTFMVRPPLNLWCTRYSTPSALRNAYGMPASANCVRLLPCSKPTTSIKTAPRIGTISFE
jgi:hypothetical protein